ncbi:dipeptidase [Dendrosporobacter sp. 1207_IL3150]|uniref:dipeptidase n=1 Tax=Dendrosporobacter sp. 1207_IL3150 TaxID=3084054 RepID=UPI002FDAB7A0
MKIIDLHCDTISALLDKPEAGGLCENSLNIDINKLKKANSLAQFFAMYINLKQTNTPLEDCLTMIDLFHTEIKRNSDNINLATSFMDMEMNENEGKISAFLTIEEGGVLKGKLSNLRNFYRLGVRLMTLTWNYPNEIGFPNCQPEYQNRGLTDFGREVVGEMNCLKMIIDVSHLSDQGFYDVSKYSDKPFVASHSNARQLKDHPRNLTDEMIKILAEKGGVIGINFANTFLGNSPMSLVEDMVRHIKHVRNVGGIDVVGLGSDFDGIDPNIEIQDISQIDKLIQALTKNSFSAGEIEKICNKNIKRLIKDCLS